MVRVVVVVGVCWRRISLIMGHETIVTASLKSLHRIGDVLYFTLKHQILRVSDWENWVWIILQQVVQWDSPRFSTKNLVVHPALSIWLEWIKNDLDDGWKRSERTGPFIPDHLCWALFSWISRLTCPSPLGCNPIRFSSFEFDIECIQSNCMHARASLWVCIHATKNGNGPSTKCFHFGVPKFNYWAPVLNDHHHRRCCDYSIGNTRIITLHLKQSFYDFWSTGKNGPKDIFGFFLVGFVQTQNL